MIKRKIPFAYAESIFEVEASFYQKHGIKVVLSDLDNTLADFKTRVASDRVKELKKFYDSLGIKMIITSNNSGDRVGEFAKSLGVDYWCWMYKPFSHRLKKTIKELGIPKEQCLLIGDQIMTDVLAGNGAKIKTLLLKPLTELDPPWTKFNRFLERGTRKKLLNKHIVKNWRETL
ncbi:MAG: YqeG family HAD IIIA-type phosphatase [Bacilli bacterium]|nr:YqeG family HAD IIIA-type phosphatase [Bacilli bacterium]